jgi:hypothetical protein
MGHHLLIVLLDSLQSEKSIISLIKPIMNPSFENPDSWCFWVTTAHGDERKAVFRGRPTSPLFYFPASLANGSKNVHFHSSYFR